MINPHRIKFNNCYSTDFDLLCCVAFNSDDGETNSFLNREQLVSESHDGRYRHSHGFKYSDVFSPKFTFTKNDFSDFSIEEQRKVLSWLTSKSTASFLSVFYDDSEVIEFECLGGWTEINTQKLANNRTVAIVATFESISPFAFSPLQIVDGSNFEGNVITINLETDDPQSAVYPKITIKQNSDIVVKVDHAMTQEDTWIEGTIYHYEDGEMYYYINSEGNKTNSPTMPSGFTTTSVFIKNIHTDDMDNSVSFDAKVKNNIANEIVILDGANRVISSNRQAGRIFGDDFSWDWIPLYEGENELSFIGNCTVEIQYRYPIKCGEF